MKKPWYKQRTTLTALSGIVMGGVGLATGGIGYAVAAPMIFNGLLAIFLRQGVENKKD